MLPGRLCGGAKILWCKTFKRRIPVVLNLEVTSRCNYSCEYCAYTGSGEKLSAEEIKELITQAEKLGTEKIILTGGEPLLRERIGEIVVHAKNQDMEVNLNTNGSLVKEKINEIKDVNNLVFSLDGGGDYMDKMCAKDSFQKVIEGIKSAKKRDVDCAVTAVLTSESREQIGTLMKISQNLKVPLNVQPMVSGEYGLDRLDLVPSTDDMKRIIEKMREFKRKNPHLVRPSLRTFDLMEKVYFEEGLIKCAAGKISGRIEGGKLKPCARFPKEVDISNGLKDAWGGIPGTDECREKCCTGDLELSGLWDLNLGVLYNQLMNVRF